MGNTREDWLRQGQQVLTSVVLFTSQKCLGTWRVICGHNDFLWIYISYIYIATVSKLWNDTIRGGFGVILAGVGGKTQ